MRCADSDFSSTRMWQLKIDRPPHGEKYAWKFRTQPRLSLDLILIASASISYTCCSQMRPHRLARFRPFSLCFSPINLRDTNASRYVCVSPVSNGKVLRKAVSIHETLKWEIKKIKCDEERQKDRFNAHWSTSPAESIVSDGPCVVHGVCGA